jgi:hypothetical protein
MLVKNNFRRFLNYITKHKLDYLLIFLVVLVALSWVQASPNFVNSESFYHAKMVESMGNSLILDDFSWQQATNLDNNFVDTNWLYHYVLSFFIMFLPTFLVIKMFGVLSVAILALYLYYWLKKHNGKWPSFFVILLFTSQIFVQDINILGPLAFELVFLLIGLELIINYKYWQLGLFSIVFATLSSWAIFLFVISLLWLIVEFVYNKAKFDKFKTRLQNFTNLLLRKIGLRDSMGKKKWLVALFSGLGLGVGLIVHPYSAKIMSYYADIVLNKTVYSSGMHFGDNFYNLFIQSKVIFIILVVSLLVFIIRRQKPTRLVSNIFVLTSFSLGLVVVANWGANIFLFFVVMLISLLWRDMYSKENWLEILYKLLPDNSLNRVLTTILLIIIVGCGVYNIIILEDGYKLNYLEDASDWLYYKTPDNSLVVNSNVEDWAPLFYFNNNNKYWLGLHQDMMRNKYTESTDDFMQMINGNEINIYAMLKSKFDADYLLINSKQQKFNSLVSTNIYFDLVYQDKYSFIYKIQ